MVVSSALTWRNAKKRALGAANVVRTGSKDDQRVLLRVTIVVDCDSRGQVRWWLPTASAAAPLLE